MNNLLLNILYKDTVTYEKKQKIVIKTRDLL